MYPGVNIAYANGKSALADQTMNTGDVLPFATVNPSESNPDLMYEITQRLELIFADQKNNADCTTMINELRLVAEEARSISRNKDWQLYSTLKQRQHKYAQILSEHVSKLLSRKEFFNLVFK